LELTAVKYKLTSVELLTAIDNHTAPIKHNTHIERLNWTTRAYELAEQWLAVENAKIANGKANKELTALINHLQSTPQPKMLPLFVFDKNINPNKFLSVGANGWSDSSRKCKTSDNPKYNRIMECQYKVRTIPNDSPEAYYYLTAQFPVK
jgi:hypothetical protein